MRVFSFICLIALASLAACQKPSELVPMVTVAPTVLPAAPTFTPAATSSPTMVNTLAASATTDTRLPPERWQEWPVVPERISPRTIGIYQEGRKLGNNPRAFSKIGDCESTPTWFMGPFDGKPEEYSLGTYTYLQPVIEA